MVADTPSVVIRPYRKDDDARGTHAAYRSAITQTASADYDPEQISAWAGAETIDLQLWDTSRLAAHTFVAVTEERIAGFADFLDEGLLDMLFVHPDFSRRGIARLLVSEVRREATRAGLSTLRTHASTTGGPAFKQFGFWVVAPLPDNVVGGQTVPNYKMQFDLITDLPFLGGYQHPSLQARLTGTERVSVEPQEKLVLVASENRGMPSEVPVTPLLEFDGSSPAFIEPTEHAPAVDAPAACVITFFGDAVQRLREDGRARLLTDNAWEDGPHPLLEIEHDGQRVALMHSGVGAPLAGALLEEVIAMGCRAFIVCGGAGVLRSDLILGHLIVVDSALRDEGTSHHYLPAGRHVDADPAAVDVLRRVLNERGIAFQTGRVWTTDAPYRETPAKIESRRTEGCIAVEMEAAALAAVARGCPESRGTSVAAQ